MINVWDYNDVEKVRVICTNGNVIEGEITAIDDEEDSGLGEDGISIMTDSGSFIGIGQSEISSIVILDGEEKKSQTA